MIAIRDLVPDRDHEVDPVPDRGPGDPQLIPRFGNPGKNPGKRRVPDQNPGPVPDLVEDPSPGLDQDRKMSKQTFLGPYLGPNLAQISYKMVPYHLGISYYFFDEFSSL